MSSSSTTSPAKAAAEGLRPSTLGTASPGLDAKPGRPQGDPSPVASSALRAIYGSGSERTHGLRPDAPVSPRALLDDPHGPPAHLGYLNQVWDSMEPALRARLASVSLHDAEASLAKARTAADVDGPGRTAADACALSMAEEEYALVLHPLQARAASLDSEHADLSGRFRYNETQRRSTAAEMATAERHHQRITSTFRAGYRQPPPARAATRSAAPAASVTSPPPLLCSGATPQPLPLFSIRSRLHPRVPPPLQPPRRSGALCPRRRHRPPACRSPPPPRGQLLLRAAPGSPHQLPAMIATWTFAYPN